MTLLQIISEVLTFSCLSIASVVSYKVDEGQVTYIFLLNILASVGDAKNQLPANSLCGGHFWRAGCQNIVPTNY